MCCIKDKFYYQLKKPVCTQTPPLPASKHCPSDHKASITSVVTEHKHRNKHLFACFIASKHIYLQGVSNFKIILLMILIVTSVIACVYYTSIILGMIGGEKNISE